MFLVGIVISINYHYNEIMNEFHFYFGFAITICGVMLTEVGAISCLGMVISPNWKMGFVNAGFLFVVIDIWASLLGSNLYLILKSIDGPEAVPFYLNIIAVGVFAVILAIILIQFKRLMRYKNIKIFTELFQNRIKEVIE